MTPKLRFPEFRKEGAWDRKKLSDLLVERKQRNRDLKFGPNEVLSVSGEYGCVNQIELLGRSYAGVSVKDYHVVALGDLVYTKSPLKKNPFGIIKENKSKPGIVSTLYAVYRTTDVGHPAYLDHYFSGDYNLNSYLQPIVRKGAKNDMKVNNLAVLGGDIYAATANEQRKIADCLTSLDEVIAAQGRKVEALKTHKRGLMQQLFPREGETRPHLRFPEFRDEPEWDELSLIEIAKFRRGSFPQPYGLPEWYDDENGEPFVQVFDVDENFRLKPRTKNRISNRAAEQSVFIAKDTLLVTLQGSIGRVAITQYDAYVDRTLLLFESFLRPLEKVFFAYVIHNLFDIEKHKAPGEIIKTITKEVLSDFEVKLPSLPEQKRIADCLSSLDAQITAESAKLDALQTHKKGLMQQLFPSPDEVAE